MTAAGRFERRERWVGPALAQPLLGGLALVFAAIVNSPIAVYNLVLLLSLTLEERDGGLSRGLGARGSL